MKTTLRSKLTLLFMAFALLLALPAMALADTLTVSNTLITNTDTSKAPGGTGTVNVWLDPTNDDPTTPLDKNGCNAGSGAEAAKVTLSSTNPAISFPNGASADLTACGSDNAKQIAYKVADDATPGQAVIQGTVTGGKSGQINQYNANDTLTVTITAPAKQNTAVSNVSGSGTYGGNADLTATLKTAAGTALSGKSVTFTLNGNSVGSANTDDNGVATKSVSLSGLDAGSYTNYVSANFAGDASNNGSTASGDLSVAKAAGSVSINNLPSNAVFGGSFTPDYTKSGDGTASTTSNTTSVCSVSSTGVVNFDAAGACKLQASVTAGTNHLAATGSEQTFEIAKAPATLSFASGTLSKTYDGSAQGVTVNTTPENLSGVSISYFNKNADGTKGSALSGAPTNAGSYIVEASLTNTNYQATSISSDQLVIAKANAVIDVQGFSGVYDGTAKGASGSATGVDGSNLSSLLDLGAKFTNIPGGTANWTFDGNANHKSASGSVAISISKAATSTTVSCGAGPFTYNGSAHTPCTAKATGAGGLNESLTVSYQNNVNAGQATASASYAGSANYEPSSGSENFQIAKANPVVTWSNPAAIDYGTALSSAQLNAQANVAGSFTYTPAAGTVLKAGTQTLKADFTPADPGNYNPASKTVTIVVNPYSFTGFFQPIDMNIYNSAKAGSAIPVKFSLGADKGMDILAQTPTATKISCDPNVPLDAVEELSTATTSGLKYDPVANQYIYNWKTTTSYAGTCQQLVVRLVDGSVAKTALFKFTK